MSRELELTATWLGEPHTSPAWTEYERQLQKSGRFSFFVLAGKRLGDDVQAAQTAFTVERRAAAAEAPAAKASAVKKESDGELEKSFKALDESADDADEHRSARRQARAARAAALAAADASDDSDDAQSEVTVEDFEDVDLSSSLQDKTRTGGNVLMTIRMLRPKLLTEELGNKWHDQATMGATDDDEHKEMLDLAFTTSLVQLNQVFILALRANLFPKGTAVSDRIRLLQPVLFNKKMEDLMCNRPDSPHEWLTKPWKMPGVVVFTALWQLASSLQHASTSSLLTSMMDILSPVSGGTLVEPLAFDTKVEAMLARYRDFLSIEDLCNHLHACIRVELIKKLKDDKSRQGPAYTKAWESCLKVRNRNHVFTMANTKRALMKAQTHMVWAGDDAKAATSSAPAKKGYVAAVSGPVAQGGYAEPPLPPAPAGALPEQVASAKGAWYSALATAGAQPDAAVLQQASVAWYGAFKDKDKDKDKAQDKAQDKAKKRRSPSSGRGRSASRGWQGDPCTTKGCPNPHTHSTTRCLINANAVVKAEAQRLERRAADSARSSFAQGAQVNKPSSDEQPYAVSSRLPVIPEHCVVPDPACPPASASASTSLSACHARELHLVEHAPADRPGPLLDSGAVVHVTNNLDRCEEPPHIPVPLEGVGGSTPAWITKCLWYTRTDNGNVHRLRLPLTPGIHELFVPNSPEELLSLAVLHEAGYQSHFGRDRSWLMTPEGDRISLYFSNRLWRMHLLDGAASGPLDSGKPVSVKDSGESVGGSVGLRVWMARSPKLTAAVNVAVTDSGSLDSGEQLSVKDSGESVGGSVGPKLTAAVNVAVIDSGESRFPSQETPLRLRDKWARIYCSASRVVLFYASCPSRSGYLLSNWAVHDRHPYTLPSWAGKFAGFKITATCGEKIIMVLKASLMGDAPGFEALCAMDDPAALKACGRQVQGFDDPLWQEVVCSIALEVVRWKCKHVSSFHALLSAPGKQYFAEAAPNDLMWGTGLSQDNVYAKTPSAWSGSNVLGWAIGEVAAECRQLAPPRPSLSDTRQVRFSPHVESGRRPHLAHTGARQARADAFATSQQRASAQWRAISSQWSTRWSRRGALFEFCQDNAGCSHPGCLRCSHAAHALRAAASTQAPFNTTPLDMTEHAMIQLVHDKWQHPSNSKMETIFRYYKGKGFPANFLALLRRFRCRTCALSKGACVYRRHRRVFEKGVQGPLGASPPPPPPLALHEWALIVGEPDTTVSDSDIILGCISAFPSPLTVELTLPDGSTTTAARSAVILAPDDDDDVNVVDHDTQPPLDVDSPSPLPPRVEGEICLDWAYSISVGFSNEKYFLVIHEENTDIVWPAPASTRGDPRLLLQEFMDFMGIDTLKELRFDGALEFGKCANFRQWARHKGAILCPSVGYNHTLNSKAETYVRITKEHMRCLLRRSNAPRRLWPYAVQHFCRVYGWWPRNKRVSAPPWTRVGPHCRVKFDRDRDLRVFGSLCYGHLPKEHRLVENKTMDDRGLEGAFLMNDNATPTFWLWSFKLRKPVNVRDGVFYDHLLPFQDPSVLERPADLTLADIHAMHLTDGVDDEDDEVEAPAPAPPRAVTPPHRQDNDHEPYNYVSSSVHADNVISTKRDRTARSALCTPVPARQPADVTPLQRPRKTPLLLDPALPLTAKQYRSWSHASEIPAHAQISLLTDAQLGKVLAYHRFTMDLPAPFFKHPVTSNNHDVTVLPVLQFKNKTMWYLRCKVVGPSSISDDPEVGLYEIQLRQGTTARTSHTHTVRQFLHDAYNNPSTLADIGIDDQHDHRFTAAMTKMWTDARAMAVRQHVCARAVDSAIRQLSTPPAPPPPSMYKQILPVRPPVPCIRPFADAARNRVWLAAFHITATTDLNLMASIDMLEPDPAHRGLALGSRFRPFWLEAEKMEWEGLCERKCFKRWRTKDLLPDDRVFNARYVYKLKRDATSGLVSRFKARLIVQGFRMKKDVDYNDTFSPTPGSTASRMMISLATSQDWELHSCDFTQAFIQADRLPEGVNGRFFIRPPPGSPDYEDKHVVYEVLRPLYGVPSSPRALHKTLDGYFKSVGFTHVGFEESVWKRTADDRYAADIYVSAHVDDSLICCPSLTVLQQFKDDMLSRFKGTDEGEVTQYLGCQLIRDRPNRTSRFVQTAYTERLLRTFGMWDCSPALTPLAPGQRLVVADCPPVGSVDAALHNRYRSIVGSIGYLVQMTRCDLAFAFSQLSQFLHRPGPVHLAAAEHVLRYLCGTHDAGLNYSDPGPDQRDVLYGWVDSDYAADPDTRRSMTGYVMALNGAPVSWKSCRQGGVTLSSSEAEYVAASAAAQENIYLRSLLAGFNRTQHGPTAVWEDNAACILMSENPVNRERSRHVDVKFHFLRERVHLGEIKLFKCLGTQNVADALTKSLPRPAFAKHREYMWGTRVPFSAFYSHSRLSPCAAYVVRFP
jgi:ribA/ribD-fused uncharacterized protein